MYPMQLYPKQQSPFWVKQANDSPTVDTPPMPSLGTRILGGSVAGGLLTAPLGAVGGGLLGLLFTPHGKARLKDYIKNILIGSLVGGGTGLLAGGLVGGGVGAAAPYLVADHTSTLKKNLALIAAYGAGATPLGAALGASLGSIPRYDDPEDIKEKERLNRILSGAGKGALAGLGTGVGIGLYRALSGKSL